MSASASRVSGRLATHTEKKRRNKKRTPCSSVTRRGEVALCSLWSSFTRPNLPPSLHLSPHRSPPSQFPSSSRSSAAYKRINRPQPTAGHACVTQPSTPPPAAARTTRFLTVAQPSHHPKDDLFPQMPGGKVTTTALTS